MYNHQLHYDLQLSTFLTDTEMALNNMRGEIWAAIPTLAENEGITFDACLGLTLQVLNLLPHIPVDISFQTDTPHHILLSGILHLQEMAPRAGWCFTSLQGSQGILHTVQSPGWGHPPTK